MSAVWQSVLSIDRPFQVLIPSHVRPCAVSMSAVIVHKQTIHCAEVNRSPVGCGNKTRNAHVTSAVVTVLAFRRRVLKPSVRKVSLTSSFVFGASHHDITYSCMGLATTSLSRSMAAASWLRYPGCAMQVRLIGSLHRQGERERETDRQTDRDGARPK